MPYKWVEPDLFLEHKGIKVYHAYNDGWHNDPWIYQYTTDVLEGTGDEADYEFDVREIARPIEINYKDHEAIIKNAIDFKMLKLPEGVKYQDAANKGIERPREGMPWS